MIALGLIGTLVLAPVPTEVMVGQLLMVGFRGQEVAAGSQVAQAIAKGQVGAVLLFEYDLALKKRGRNIANPTQVKRLVAQLQGLAKVPLLIAADQEGGMVRRFKSAFGLDGAWTARRLGRSGVAKTRAEAGRIAGVFRDLGVNLNLAPVVDLDSNPNNPAIGHYERAFHSDPQVVTRHGAAFVEAHRRRGVLTALKHFPGHGSSRADSHFDLPDITATWQRDELEPYRRLIAAGQADVVLLGHLAHRGLDATLPTSLSPAVIDDLLRKQMGFDGVVITDDLAMSAIGNRYDLERSIELALLAGNDMLMFGNQRHYDPDLIPKVFALTMGLVKSGRLPRARIEEAYGRVMALKAKLPDPR